MAVRRIIPYHESPDLEATRVFYTRVLGLEEGSFGGGYIGFGSGQAQVVFAPPGVEPVLPDMGVDVDSREAVDAAHAQALRAGHEVITAPWTSPGVSVASLFAIRTVSSSACWPMSNHRPTSACSDA